jgi:hypothetical protein
MGLYNYLNIVKVHSTVYAYRLEIVLFWSEEANN